MSVAQTVGNLTPKDLRFLWEIPNFSKIKADTGTSIYSPVFHTAVPNNKTLQWRLQLYPNGSNNDSKGCISLFVHNMNKFAVTVKYSLSIMNELNWDILKPSFHPVSNTFNAQASWGWPKFAVKALVMNEQARILLSDTLLICCSILSVSSPSIDYDIDEDDSAALKYNEQLFQTGNYSDITFSIQDKEMNLHKVIVASVSPVFEAMFATDMRENNDNLVVITDIKYDIMKELFRYIYTRSVKNMEKIASDLLVAADKYAVGGLKMLCEVNLSGSLNEDNALQRLHLAVMHNTSYLKPKVVDFVAGKLKTFVRKEEFKDLPHDCKDEIFNALANK